MSGTFWTIEQVEPIIKERNELRQLVAELEAAITLVLEQQPYYMATRVAETRRILRDALGEGAAIARLYAHEETLRQLVAELEAAYAERGERMKIMKAHIEDRTDLRDELDEWFDPETGEPLPVNADSKPR